jgi:large subunit ribosomal protein L25
MSKQLKLSASIRPGTGRSSVKKLRTAGFIPAVIYGARQEPRNLQVSRRELGSLLNRAAGEHLLLDLEIVDGTQKETRLALLQEVQHDPVNGQMVHIDLLAVSQDEKLQSSVPVEPFGTPAGVKNAGGILEQLMREVDIECLPRDLPESIRVDVSGLEIGASLHVGDLPFPEGVRPTVDPSVTILHVAAPRVEEAPVAAAAEAVAQPEVIKEKKDDTAESKDAK